MTRLLSTACFMSSLLACAPSLAHRYGPVAVYDRDERGWIAEGPGGRFVFVNPFTGCTLRCRAEVEQYKVMNADLANSQNRNNSAWWRAGLVTFPTTLPMVPLAVPMAAVQAVFSDHPAARYRRLGEAAMRKQDYERASIAFTLAAIQGDRYSIELFAQAKVMLGQKDDAKKARESLQCSGGRLGDAIWSRIEDWLEEAGDKLPACEDSARDPVEVNWSSVDEKQLRAN